MANANISETVIGSQFKDHLSVKERLFNCGVQIGFKSPVNKYRSSKKNDEDFRRYLSSLKTALA